MRARQNIATETHLRNGLSQYDLKLRCSQRFGLIIIHKTEQTVKHHLFDKIIFSLTIFLFAFNSTMLHLTISPKIKEHALIASKFPLDKFSHEKDTVMIFFTVR